jgi:MIP family channel proteins
MRLKRYAAEFVGMFVIVFAPLALSASGGDTGLMGAAWVSGLAVLAMIFALGPVSAAHFNPAVTLGFAVAGRFPRQHVLPYWVSQIGGALLAGGLGWLIFGGGHGVHIPHGSSLVQDFAVEVVLTFILMVVIIAVATDRRVNGTVPGLAIGLTVVLGVLIGGPITGGSMNPARSLGPAVFAGGPALENVWLYLTAPFLGAVLASLVYEAMRVSPEHGVSAAGGLDELT